MVTGGTVATRVFHRAAAGHTKVRGNRCRLPTYFSYFTTVKAIWPVFR